MSHFLSKSDRALFSTKQQEDGAWVLALHRTGSAEETTGPLPCVRGVAVALRGAPEPEAPRPSVPRQGVAPWTKSGRPQNEKTSHGEARTH